MDTAEKAELKPRGQAIQAILQLVLLVGLLVAVYVAFKAGQTWIAVGAGAAYLVAKNLIRRANRQEERTVRPKSDDAFEDTTDGSVAMGCIGLLILPAVMICGAVALKYNLSWLMWTTIAGFAAFLVIKARLEFRMPARTAEGIVGGRPRKPVSVPSEVAEQLAKSKVVADGETVLAAVDDSWTDNGTAGTLLTDRRVLGYGKSGILLDLPLDRIDRVLIRRMWYPGADFLGRGEVFGSGPVIVLRLAFRMKDGSKRRVRFSAYAGKLHPFLSALFERLADRVHVRRTLPGI